MKQRIARAAGVLFYAVALTIVVLYINLSINPYVRINVLGKILCLAGSCAAVYFGSSIFATTVKEENKSRCMKLTFFVAFLWYFIFLSDMVFFDERFGRVRIVGEDAVPFAMYLRYSCNFIPFKTFVGYFDALIHQTVNTDIIVINLAGNLLAFAPFAFFLPLLFKKMKQFSWFSMAAILISAVVELVQCMTRVGSCDIDDVILNAGGACIFYCILHRKRIVKFICFITGLEY